MALRRTGKYREPKVTITEIATGLAVEQVSKTGQLALTSNRDDPLNLKDVQTRKGDKIRKEKFPLT